MYRTFFRFLVTVITILAANLITTALSDYMVTYRNNYKPLTFTFLAMMIIVVVFYPLFTKLEEWVKSVSVRIMKSGKSVGRYLGVILTFFAAMLLLMYFYARMWYHIDLFRIVISGNLGAYL